MANKEIQLNLTGKSGTTYTFFPQYPLLENRDSKGSGIYVFTGNDDAIADIQFLSDEEDVKATLQRMLADGAEAFYFKDSANETEADAMIDDMKNGDDYRKKSD